MICQDQVAHSKQGDNIAQGMPFRDSVTAEMQVYHIIDSVCYFFCYPARTSMQESQLQL